MVVPRTLDRYLDGLADLPSADRRSDALVRVAERSGATRVASAAANVLGHPAHPLLTDLPIGFWTSAWMLDLLGHETDRVAARRLIGLGVVSAVPTIVLGLGDLPALTPRKRRVAVLHAAANSSAVLCYLVSWWQRRDDRHERAVRWGWAGATVATIGGALGGFLSMG
ncbi:MAG: DUF2231 domain-containing protein [Acidimicrobiales bacterium]